ncbi:MAG: hypothetical protein KAG99_10805 [Bacteroidales bacterium]|nr:hypothetical protein [Bacteroidales bacterium]
MFRIINIAVKFLVTIVILLSLGGYHVYQHDCFCSGRSNASFIVENVSCQHENVETESTASHDHSSFGCCKINPQNSNDNKEIGHNCCKTSKVFLKLSELFNIPMENSFCKIHFPAFVFSEISPESHQTELNFLTSDNTPDLPPPLFGKALLFTLHQLKITPAVA